MFEIHHDEDGKIRLEGRLDASQVDRVTDVLDRLSGSWVIDFSDLAYISSAGLGALFATHKRLVDAGGALTIVNLNPHIREIFAIAGFDHIFEIS